jgi:hypothetical protein
MSHHADDPSSVYQPSLSPDDADALDALAESGLNPTGVPESLRARADRLLSILKLLDAPVYFDREDSATLLDLTMARILHQPVRDEPEPMLSPDDEEALDALVTERFHPERVPARLRPRAHRAAAIEGLLSLPVPSAAPGLVARTMERIPLRIRPRESLRERITSFHFADLVSVAAVILIGLSVAWPVMTTWNAHRMRTACGSNFAALASAFARYSADFRDQLPVAAAGLGTAPWWEVGQGPGRSNSANLFRLPKHRYVDLCTLACPNNPCAKRTNCSPTDEDWSCINEVSYSYQNMFAKSRPAWRSGPGVVILADASPVVRRTLSGAPWASRQNSENHAGAGQWILLNDGSAGWAASPLVGHDNIWLTRQQEAFFQALEIKHDLERRGYRGLVTIEILAPPPESSDDAFLVP